MEQYRHDTVDASYSVVQINGGAYSGTDDPSSAGDVAMEYSLTQFCTPSMAQVASRRWRLIAARP